MTDENWTALVSLLPSAGVRPYTYPDPRCGPQDVADSTGERAEESALWHAWLGARRGALALDAGCGLGAHTPALRARYEHVLSVDGDPVRVAAAERVYGSSEQHRFHAVRLDDPCWTQPGLTGRFDTVQCMQVLGHLPLATQIPVLRTLCALMAPSGVMLLAVPFSQMVVDELCKTLLTDGGMSEGITIEPAEFDALARAPVTGVLPVRHFSMASVRRLVRDAGLSIRELQVYNVINDVRADVMVLLEAA